MRSPGGGASVVRASATGRRIEWARVIWDTMQEFGTE
jgi:hypothetical protein